MNCPSCGKQQLSTGLPRLLWTQSNPFRHGFKRLRTDTAQMAVPTSAMIEQFDVIRDLGSGHLTSCIDALLDPLLFQATKERFGHCVIPAVATPAHTRFKMMRLTEASPRITAKL